MLMILGVEICGEPLQWGDVVPFVKVFHRLDVSKTGRIDGTDLELYAKQEAEKRKELKKIKDPKKRLSEAVNARDKTFAAGLKATLSRKLTGLGDALDGGDVVAAASKVTVDEEQVVASKI